MLLVYHPQHGCARFAEAGPPRCHWRNNRIRLIDFDYTLRVAPRALQSPLSIVVLGLLAEQPQHPYAMRVLIRERGHERIAGRGGASLYDTVRRLERAGLVEAEQTEREGRRPERTVYRITASGGRELAAWVREALADPERTGQFPAALSFMYVLGADEAIAHLQARADTLGELVERADAAIAAALGAGVPSIFLSEERHAQSQRRAERQWIDDFITQVHHGDLRWPQPRSTQEQS
jgi:DNA-binding PadR family transcriptional regulator